MITKLQIKNYQSHKNSELAFSEGINVIVGSSDAGKSAILRSIRWLLFNRPLGSNFIRHGTTSCSLVLETNRGKIERHKGNDNYYKVNDTEFRAIGTDIPEDVKDVINVEEINVQRQLDKHFLILGSGGEIASTLNEVLNIDEIDKSVSHCSSKVRSLDKEINIFSSQLEQEREEFKKYDNLDEIIEKIKKWEKDENKVSDTRNRINELDTLIDEIKEVEDRQKTYKNVDTILDKIDECLLDIYEYDTKEIHYSRLEDLIDEYKVIDKKLIVSKDIDRILRRIVIIEDTIKNQKKDEEDHFYLKDLITSINNIDTKLSLSIVEIREAKMKEDEAREDYQEAVKELGLCPFCGQEMGDDVCQDIVSKI